MPELTPEQIAQLEAPFQPVELETKPGRAGKQFTFVTTAAVTRRLNEVFGYRWSSRVTRLEVGQTAVIATVQLRAAGISHEQAGGQAIQRDRDGEPVELGDDCKAAISAALKKAAMLYGIGLYLCERADEPARTDEPATEAKRSIRPPEPFQTVPPKVTAKQLAFVRSLRQRLGWTPQEVQALAEDLCGNPDVANLTASEASQLIEELKAAEEAEATVLAR